VIGLSQYQAAVTGTSAALNDTSWQALLGQARLRAVGVRDAAATRSLPPRARVQLPSALALVTTPMSWLSLALMVMVLISRAIIVLVVALVGVILVGRVASQVWIGSQPPCGDLPLRVEPVAVRLVPSLDEHQSWVAFAVPEAPTISAFCADGRLLNDNPGLLMNGLVQFGVRTTWVDLLWVGGALPDYGNAAHWELRYRVGGD
jgi:hypothetical protein